MSNIWSEVQALTAAVRALREDVEGLQEAHLRQSQDRYLDAISVEALRVDIQRLWAELAGVKEALREALDDEEDW